MVILIISIVLVQKIGLVGVYIGTIVSGLIANITKPVIIYRDILNQPVKEYFTDSVKYVLVMIISFALLSVVKRLVMPEVTVFTFAMMFVIICVAFNGIFLGMFGRCEEFSYLLGIVKKKVKRK